MKLAKESHFVFQGDSITDGGRGRSEDLNHILGHGYVYLIGSRLGADYPDRRYRFTNRGVSGNRVVDLLARWEKDAKSLRPDVLSIMIGVNDANFSLKNRPYVSEDQFERVYSMLLEESREANPELTLILCEPFILPVGPVQENLAEWKEQIGRKQAVVQRLAKRFDALWVPLQEEFDRASKLADPSYWIWDGLHPTAAGHELIARKWLACIKGL